LPASSTAREVCETHWRDFDALKYASKQHLKQMVEFNLLKETGGAFQDTLSAADYQARFNCFLQIVVHLQFISTSF
jgi:hypothetical protein